MNTFTNTIKTQTNIPRAGNLAPFIRNATAIYVTLLFVFMFGDLINHPSNDHVEEEALETLDMPIHGDCITLDPPFAEFTFPHDLTHPDLAGPAYETRQWEKQLRGTDICK